MMLQPPRGRAVSFYEWEGRGTGRDATAQAPRLYSSYFVNGRAERLGWTEMRRLHFYEWGGLRMALRRRDAEIFMNGKKWRMTLARARACVCEREERGERGEGMRRWWLFWSQGQCQA